MFRKLHIWLLQKNPVAAKYLNVQIKKFNPNVSWTTNKYIKMNEMISHIVPSTHPISRSCHGYVKEFVNRFFFCILYFARQYHYKIAKLNDIVYNIRKNVRFTFGMSTLNICQSSSFGYHKVRSKIQNLFSWNMKRVILLYV